MIVHMQQYPFIFSNEKKYRIWRHVTFWVAWWLFCVFLYAYTAGVSFFPDYKRLPISMVDAFFFLIVHMFFSYSLMYFVVPKLILKTKYVAAAIAVVVLIFAAGFLSSVVGRFVLPAARELLLGNNGEALRYPPRTSFYLSLLAGLRGGITIGGLAAAIKLMKYWYLKEQRNLQLQKENVESQLQLLKAQVHPHFLFNTLNNIYSYTQNISPVASTLVTGLSDMLRFILYECNQPLVPLSKEFKMIRDYISLEQIRYGNKLDLHLDIPEETNDLYIAPLLLLPLIENCFKHGASRMLDQPWVSLKISIDHKQMHMKLVNGKIKDTEEKSLPSGIGISNVKKRLELIYCEKYQLFITNDDEVFIVNLKLQLEQRKEKAAVSAPLYEVSHA